MRLADDEICHCACGILAPGNNATDKSFDGTGMDVKCMGCLMGWRRFAQNIWGMVSCKLQVCLPQPGRQIAFPSSGLLTCLMPQAFWEVFALLALHKHSCEETMLLRVCDRYRYATAAELQVGHIWRVYNVKAAISSFADRIESLFKRQVNLYRLKSELWGTRPGGLICRRSKWLSNGSTRLPCQAVFS